MIEGRGSEDKVLGFPLRDSNSLLHGLGEGGGLL